jgi:integrase/recombinase XerD
MAYARAVKRFFDCCEEHHLGLEDIEPIAIVAYIEELGFEIGKPSVKQHLAAIRQLFDYIVTGGVLLSTPAGSVRGPKYVVTRGKTPVRSGGEMRQLEFICLQNSPLEKTAASKTHGRTSASAHTS